MNISSRGITDAVARTKEIVIARRALFTAATIKVTTMIVILVTSFLVLPHVL